MVMGLIGVFYIMIVLMGNVVNVLVGKDIIVVVNLVGNMVVLLFV